MVERTKQALSHALSCLSSHCSYSAVKLQKLKDGFMRGIVSEDDFAGALCGHQAAVDATKSPQRERAVI